MNSHEISQYFEKVEKTTKRLEMQALLGELYNHLSPTEGAQVSYFLLGRIVPEFLPVEFQLAEKSVLSALEQLTGKSLRDKYKEVGDLGELWLQEAPECQATPTFAFVYEALWQIASSRGTGSQKQKQQLVTTLLQNVSPLMGKYILRMLVGKLRLGASDRTILEALAKHHHGELEQLKKLYADTSDLGHAVFLFLSYGNAAYEKGTLVPGVPISAKLVSPERNIENIFKRIPAPYLEPKYDGLRIQIHVFKTKSGKALYGDRSWSLPYEEWKKAEKVASSPVETLSLFGPDTVEAASESDFEVQLFSRNLENMTAMFPEVVTAAKQLLLQYARKSGTEIQSIVLDGEVIGYNDILEEYLPFSDTISRKRKYGVESAQEQSPVKVFSFDILLLDGKNLTATPLADRKKLLSFLEGENKEQSIIVKTPFVTVSSIDEASELFESYMDQGLEGVIFKNPLSVYDAGVRNFEWIKFKRDMVEDHKLTDSLDVVIIGYFFGKGRLATVGLGKILTAVYDAENDQFVSFTKVGTKMSDEQRLEMRRRCDELKVDDKPLRVSVAKSLTPDVWIYPQQVIEIIGYEISKSINPAHVSGYSLRFPKFLRYREKTPEQATTVTQLADMSK
jgi:DNA ligase-1